MIKNINDEELLTLIRLGSSKAFNVIVSKYIRSSSRLGYLASSTAFKGLSNDDFKDCYSSVLYDCFEKYRIGEGRFVNFFIISLKREMNKRFDSVIKNGNCFSLSSSPSSYQDCTLEEIIEDPLNSHEEIIKNNISYFEIISILGILKPFIKKNTFRIIDYLFKGYSLTEISKITRYSYHNIRNSLNKLREEFSKFQSNPEAYKNKEVKKKKKYYKKGYKRLIKTQSKRATGSK